jgi:hypothetical protein
MQKYTKRKQVLYIGFYSNESREKIRRYSTPSAVNKMDYIANVFKRLDCDIQIVSPSWLIYKSNHLKYVPSNTRYNNSGITIKYSPSFTSNNKILNILSRFFSLLWLSLYLFKNTKKDTIVTLYHSASLYFPVLYAKKFRHFKLILEIEEIYHLFTKTKKKHENALFSLADGYLFSNKRIKNYFINDSDKKKPFAVINGVYNIRKSLSIKNKENDFVKVVFAGNIELTRKGAFNTVSCAKYLNDKYLVYIIGFGEKNDIKKLIKEIKKTNNFLGYEKCKYLGVKHGKDYDDFLSSCDIAINPQEANENYMQFAFPSKVISYLCYNLKTVSTKLQTIEDSEFADLITLVQTPTPEKFANAIMQLKLNKPFDASDRIKKADFNFLNDLKQLIS